MKTSTKNLPGLGETKLSFNMPTFEEVREKLGEEFMLADYLGHKIANNAASAIKSACKSAFGLEGGAKKEKIKTAHVELVERIKRGESLNLLDFMNKPRESTGKEAEIVALIRAKWELSEKKAEFLKRLGLDAELVSASAEEVVSAYQEAGEIDL